MLGVRAATSITNERERDTLDALITTPMSADGMLFSKVLGNLTSMRPAWIWFTCLMLLAVFTGGLHPLAVPFIISAWLVYALFITMIGLMYSMFCKSSIWSALFTVLTTLAVGGGHWLITGCCCAPVFSMMMIGVNRNGPPPEAVLKLAEYFVKFQAGLTPPFVFAWCSPPLIDTHHMMDRREFWELTGMSFLGLFLWTAGCAIMWFGVLAPKFRQMMRRHELEYS